MGSLTLSGASTKASFTLDVAQVSSKDGRGHQGAGWGIAASRLTHPSCWEAGERGELGPCPASVQVADFCSLSSIVHRSFPVSDVPKAQAWHKPRIPQDF